MQLETQCHFADIYDAFIQNKHTVETISELVLLVRNNSRNMSDNAQLQMLEIPLCVLKEQSELKISANKWAKDRGIYFAGNAQNDDFRSQFAEECFDLDIMIQYLEYIMEDQGRLHSDFKLRNIEVTLREAIAIKKYSGFEKSGMIFAHTMEKAFDL